MPFRIAILLLLFSNLAMGAEDEAIWKFTNSSQIISDQKILEFWATNNSNEVGPYSHKFNLRYYNPLEIANWRGTIRLDTNLIATSPHPFVFDNNGQYSSGNNMITVWGQDNDFLKSLNATVGARVILPHGNNNQWSVGPQLGWAFKPLDPSQTSISTFAPLIRYMYGFNANNTSVNPPSLERNLQLFPTAGFKITERTQIVFWDENGMTFNSGAGAWFVPIDAMVTHRVNKNFLFAIGASKKIVDTYQQYDWSLYGRLSLNF